MCGRFVLSSDGDRLADHYGLVAVPPFIGVYNIAPSALVPVVRLDSDKEAAVCHWGFIPHWVREPVLKSINARAETLTDKPYFRDAFRRRRCLVPANGYYEWCAENGGKQPYFIRMVGVDLFSFAVLWPSWQGPDGPIVFSPAHLPDAPARVTETLAEHADRQFCDVAADESAAFGQEAGYALVDADGFAAVFGLVDLFDGREEYVHVHEGDVARPVVVGIRHGTVDPCRGDEHRSRGEFAIR